MMIQNPVQLLGPMGPHGDISGSSTNTKLARTLMVILIGYYFGLAYLFLASALVLVKFIQFKIINR